MSEKNLRFTVMKQRLYIFIFALFTAAIVVSCSKGGSPSSDGGGGVHTPTPTDTTAPVLDIYTPANLQEFSNGGVISITGKISDDYGLYRGSVRIVNDANGSVIKEQLYEIHALLSYNFSVSHAVTTNAASNYTVTVSFEDHGTNVTTKSVKVKVNP
jgi:hypothetical protein